MKRKEGQIATPKDFPILRSKIVKTKEMFGETVYVLENGTHYTENELQPIKEESDVSS